MLPDRLYTARQCRDLDLLTIKSGVSGYELMCRAGAAALALLLQSWPRPAFIHVVCGTGNNGGDGLVLARLARQQALPVMVYLAGDPAQLHGEALQAWQDALAADVPVCTADTGGQWSAGIVVDALLGIGLQGAVRDSAAATIDRINNSGLPVLALDVPSGICADSGKVLGCAVMASKTITFIAAKRGLYTGAAVDYSGDIVVAGLSVPEAFHAQVGATVDCLDLAALQACLPVRPRSAHKGLYGHVLVVGGNHGMAGAALMAATAAARTGAGLVSVATRPAHVAAYIARQPEIMVHAVDYRHELQALLERASVLAIGPGLGQDAWAEQMLAAAIACGKPLVLDADALNLLSRQPGTRFEQACVLTPHPGEAARLLGSSNEQVNADRFLAAAQLAQHYQAVVLLKGAGSVIAACGGLSLCPYGNAGMASGGMGDVLAGVIAGLMAQGLAVSTAVQLAVLVHARAADVLAQQHGQRGLLASDLIPQIRQLLNAA